VVIFRSKKRSASRKKVWETLTGLTDKGDDHFIMSNAEDFVGAFVYSRKDPTKFVMCVSQFGIHLNYFSELISGFHRASLLLVTFINRLMH
jgi:hypothetical protein